MNADEFVEQLSGVQHLVGVLARNVPRLHHYSIACTDNPMNLSLFELKLQPIMVRMSRGKVRVTYELQALPLSTHYPTDFISPVEYKCECER